MPSPVSASARLGPLLLLALFGSAAAEEWPSLAQPAKDLQRPGRQDGALIIAIEDYLVVDDVPGARTNAADWDRWFEARGVPVSRVVVLRDSEAVRESILRQAAQVAADMPTGGTLWVVYIGHGAPSADGQDGVLVGADAQQKAEILYARSVGRRELLATLKTGRQAETVLVLDACFSGKGGQGSALVPGLQPLIPVAMDRVDRVTMLSAGAGDEFAGGLPGTARPAFSYLLLGALHGWREADEDEDGAVSLGEAVTYTRGALRRVATDRKQTPEIAGPLVGLKVARASTAGPDLRAFGGASVVRPPTGPVVEGAGSVADQLARLEAEQVLRDRAAAEAVALRARLDAEKARLEAELQATVHTAAAATRARAQAEWARLVKLADQDFEGSRPAIAAFIQQYEGAKVVVDGREHAIAVPEVAAARAAGVTPRGVVPARHNPADIDWVKLPGGTFWMGGGGFESDELPRHQVTLPAFAMGRTEVTIAQWKRCVAGGACPNLTYAPCWSPVEQKMTEADCPMVNVSWEEARGFAKWAGGRLPSEAEWEFAAGGAFGHRYVWSGTELPTCERAVMNDGTNGCGKGDVAWAVCSKPKGNSVEGLCDLAGNVWEWVDDPYKPYQDTSDHEWKWRVLRGGGWFNGAEYVRVTDRNSWDPARRGPSLGFRLAR